jgi:hypothetical protein
MQVKVDVTPPAISPGPTPSLLDTFEREAGVALPAIEAKGLTLGQPVFHPTYGYGEVTAIDGNAITFRATKDPAVTQTVAAQEIITKNQAEVELKTCWFAGGAKAWRRAQAKWASITKNLCRHGEWKDVLEKHDLNRSSMDDLIRRFEEEMTWEAQDTALAAANLPESGNLDPSEPDQALKSSVYTVTGARQVNERTPDPENDRREANKRAEIAKRLGVNPTHHKTILSLRRPKLDPEKLARYYLIREKNQDRVREIMHRKIDEGIEEVLALAPTPLPQPSVRPALATQDAVSDVRSALLNLGFGGAAINKVQFNRELDFEELMRIALKQLKPE